MIESHDFVNAILTNGGVSLDRSTGQPIEFDFGYIVSEPVPLAILPETPTIEQLDRWLPKWQKQVQSHRGAFLGAWRDDKSGSLFVDINHWYPRRDDAMDAGRRNNQLAIFHCGTNESLYLE